MSQEDIAEIASADIPAEDVAMLEDGSGADDKAAEVEKPAAASKGRKLLKHAPPVTAPEEADVPQDTPTEDAGEQCTSDPITHQVHCELVCTH